MAFTYLTVKSAKCLCLLPVVLVLVMVLRILFCLHHWIFQLPWGQLPHPVVTQLYETGSVPNPDQCLLSSTPRVLVLRSAVLLLVLDSRLESTLNVVKYLSTQVFEISLDGRRDRGLYTPAIRTACSILKGGPRKNIYSLGSLNVK